MFMAATALDSYSAMAADRQDAIETVEVQAEDTVSSAALEQKMFALVNVERSSRGLQLLTLDDSLVKAARLKSRDLIENNYFDHISPVYGKPSELLSSLGINYSLVGENLAGFSTVESAHDGLMNSVHHRENILRPEFTKIGIGIIKGGPYGVMITQLFIAE
jgi:uncharacterized YkwD family protein